MAINQFQKNAYLAEQEFVDQVNGIVTKEAQYKYSAWEHADGATKQNLARVAKYPSDYGFPITIVSDNNWSHGFDEWAANPNNLKADIESAIGTWWEFCTGIKNEPPPAPPGQSHSEPAAEEESPQP